MEGLMKILADELMNNAIDMHCHCYPEFTLDAKKRMEDVEWINLASQMGMRGAVLKSHFWPTMTNVYFLQKQIPEGFKLFSSITLNLSSGGVNAWAVEAAAKQGAKVIFMPTWSSKNDQELKSVSRIIKKYISSLENYKFEGVSILDSNGLIPEAKKILQIAKEMDLVLCTGHISPSESLELARQAKNIGFQKLIFSHPDNPSVKATIQEMKEAIRLGAYVEFCFLGTLPLIQRKHPRDMVSLIREIGAEHCVLSTDSFYDWVPPEPEIMRMGIANLLELGVSKEEMKLMVQDNQVKLLDLV
jgi:Tat protein secretion system quality control protein TatD with DNase activity